MLFQRNKISHILSRFAGEHSLYLGTTSWRFTGWCGTLYDEDLYLYGKRFSKKRFEEHCLEEYAAVFPTVEVDSSYYAIPKTDVIKHLADQVPDSFRFSFKVPRDITMKKFPNVSDLGKKAGQMNEYFLSSHLFKMGFLRQLESVRDKVGAIIFEFPHFHAGDFAHGREFVEQLDQFFDSIPDDGRYAVEVRNANLIHPDYFAMLKRHGVAHVYNQWTSIPPVSEQLQVHPAEDNPFIIGRFLLTPGTQFESARRKFEPFNRLQEIDPDARESMVRLSRAAFNHIEPTPHFIYASNDLEGNALHTISDVVESLEDFLD